MSRSLIIGLGAALVAGLIGTTTLIAQTKDPDLLDDVKKREKIAADALEADIKKALADADALQSKDAAKAALVLKYALARLDADTALTANRRTALKNTLQERIKAIEASPSKPKPEPLPPPPDTKEPDPKNADLERELKQVRILRQVGEYGQAAKLADDLAKRYPDNAATTAAKRVAANELQLREYAKFLDEKAWNTALAMREVDKSSIPIVGDIEYPKDWAEKSARRLKKYQEGRLSLTKKEAEIIKTLESATTKPLDMKGVPFDRVLDHFADEYKLPLMIDRNALKDLDINYETTKIFARMPKGVTVRTALRAALADAGLTYIIKNEVIYITSPDRAKSELVTRIYPIDDLLGPGSPFLFTNPFAQQMQQLDQEAKAQKMIEMIKGLVEPGSWTDGGGAGTIAYDPIRRALIVKNTAEVINALGGGIK